jgi:MFS family permease
MAARVLVGLAGAGLIVMALSVLTVLFSKEERPKAVGIISAATFVAFPIGPILGGWLLTNYWWGWVFLINVPVVVVALVAVVALVPESRASSARAWTSSGWRPRPWAGDLDLRPDQGRPGWLGQCRRPGHDGRWEWRCWSASSPGSAG